MPVNSLHLRPLAPHVVFEVDPVQPGGNRLLPPAVDRSIVQFPKIGGQNGVRAEGVPAKEGREAAASAQFQHPASANGLGVRREVQTERHGRRPNGAPQLPAPERGLPHRDWIGLPKQRCAIVAGWDSFGSFNALEQESASSGRVPQFNFVFFGPVWKRRRSDFVATRERPARIVDQGKSVDDFGKGWFPRRRRVWRRGEAAEAS
mmetsp:Transcript_4379/g.12246  ORF Transcript_4379/g.12246 Transcript_4379/m.12246 type:complete len:205 (+) Transcript_4379:606-1220(+)